MLIIGLTGGIGSGKSTVAKHFTSLGVPVIDADSVARDVVEPGQIALTKIRERFGEQILDKQGRLERTKLRQIIFSDTQAKSDLEAILHPIIRSRMWELAAQQTTPYVVLEIPLLIETGQYKSVDRVLVVDTPEQRQIEHVCQRDNTSPEEAQAILNAQIPRHERQSKADDIISNTGTIDDLYTQVVKVHKKYLALSTHKPA